MVLLCLLLMESKRSCKVFVCGILCLNLSLLSVQTPVRTLKCDSDVLFFWQMAQSQRGEAEANKRLAGDQK